MKSFFLIFVLFTLSSARAISQKKVLLSSDEISSHISGAITKYYKPDEIILKRVCGQGCIFAKFEMDESGKHFKVEFSNDSMTVVKLAIKTVADSLQKDYLLLATLKKLHRVVILPFIYDYQLGCKIPPINLKGTKEEATQRMIVYYKTMESINHFYEDIGKMLYFNNKKTNFLNCLLLEPVWYKAFGEDF